MNFRLLKRHAASAALGGSPHLVRDDLANCRAAIATTLAWHLLGPPPRCQIAESRVQRTPLPRYARQRSGRVSVEGEGRNAAGLFCAEQARDAEIAEKK
jgi:hypothetical protein